MSKKRTEIIDITYLLKQKRIKEDLESHLHKMGIFNLYDVVVEAEQENNLWGDVRDLKKRMNELINAIRDRRR